MKICNRETQPRKKKSQSNSWLKNRNLSYIEREMIINLYTIVELCATWSYWNWKVARETKFQVFQRLTPKKKIKQNYIK